MQQKIIIKNVYMDDIIDSFDSYEKAISRTREVDDLLMQGGFYIKKVGDVFRGIN